MINFYFRNNLEKKRLEFRYHKDVAYIDYIIETSRLILLNTFIPEKLHLVENFGFDFLLAVKKFSLDNHLIIYARCPYAKAVLKNIDQQILKNE